MHAMAEAAYEVLHPYGVILDFSDLWYQWGDLVGQVLNVPEILSDQDSPPFAIVLGAESKDALMSLLLEDLGWSSTELAWVFKDIVLAKQFVKQRMVERKLAVAKESVERKRKEALTFWELLGAGVGPEPCRVEGCGHLRIKDSWLCRVHHYEDVQHEPCPFKSQP
jgi:hypothetical protein